MARRGWLGGLKIFGELNMSTQPVIFGGFGGPTRRVEPILPSLLNGMSPLTHFPVSCLISTFLVHLFLYCFHLLLFILLLLSPPTPFFFFEGASMVSTSVLLLFVCFYVGCICLSLIGISRCFSSSSCFV